VRGNLFKKGGTFQSNIMDFKSSLEQTSQGEEEVLNKGADDMLIKHIINYFANYLGTTDNMVIKPNILSSYFG